MKLPAVLSQGFLAAFPMRSANAWARPDGPPTECHQKFVRGEEIKLQKLCLNWLSLHGIYSEWDRTDKRTSGKRGRADIRACVVGYWLSIECKAAGEPLSREQAQEAVRLRNSGGRLRALLLPHGSHRGRPRNSRRRQMNNEKLIHADPAHSAGFAPKSQAEQDKEENFNAHRRLKIPSHQPSDLARRLEHYQEMCTRMLEDPEFREKIILEAETGLERRERKRSELRRARAKKKGPKKIRTSSRPDKKPPGYFAHLDEVLQTDRPNDWSAWYARRSEWYEKPKPEPPPPERVPNLGDYQREFDAHMAQLIKEYGMGDDPKLLFVWKPKLTELALNRMHPQVEEYLKQLRT